MMTAIFRRLCLSVLILFMVAVFVFMATEVLPGDALDARDRARQDPRVSAANRAIATGLEDDVDHGTFLDEAGHHVSLGRVQQPERP